MQTESYQNWNYRSALMVALREACSVAVPRVRFGGGILLGFGKPLVALELGKCMITIATPMRMKNARATPGSRAVLRLHIRVFRVLEAHHFFRLDPGPKGGETRLAILMNSLKK